MATAETSIIYQIGIHATAETTVPSLPNKYSHISLPGWTVIGSRDRGDDADLDEDNVDIGLVREDVEINPPMALTAKDALLRKAGADSFEFVCYDGSEDLLELDSDISIAGNIASMSTTRTKRTVLIEVNGLWVDYFPNCVVRVSQMPTGIAEGGISRTRFQVRPLGTSTIGGGWQRHWFQAAS